MTYLGEGFLGTHRFIVEGRLGEGGMGVVHRVRDLERGEVVALKTMGHVQPSTLLRFKREFRALADIAHPNVVQLYELFSEHDQWFFTMELVEGTDLLTWVGASLSQPPPPRPVSFETSQAPTSTLVAPERFYEWYKNTRSDAAPPSLRGGRTICRIGDMARLRNALAQLAEGLSAIHAAGKIHRDIKPSNVMVTKSGRVVLLDFGVVVDLASSTGRAAHEPLAGTPAYISPEQSALEQATPASDWYSVGVILYEALTGRLPFDGLPLSVLMAKRQGPPPPPSKFVDGIPDDLERLTMDLLQREPHRRPTASEVLVRLSDPSATRDDSSEVISSVRPPFVGRRQEMNDLRAAYDASADGPSVVMLHGPSGMGKSTLAARFLRQLADEPDVLVLSGRCYEREAVPFKAIDPIVDELRRWLGVVSDSEVDAYLPPDLEALARVFPVLGDVGERMYDDAQGAGEPDQVRRRAFLALQAMFAAIAKRYRLVVHVDDLQWCDSDSVQLLEALFSTTPWPWLFVCSYRSDLASDARQLAELRALLVRSQAVVSEIEVGELSPGEAEDLARQLVGTGDIDIARLVMQEARGNPMFVAELARWAKDHAGATPLAGVLSLDQILLDRVARLPDDARALLETLSVARGPLPHSVASQAANLDGKKRGPALLLRGARLVTMRGLDDTDFVETSHDRLREAILENLSAERRRGHHASLALSLASLHTPDPDAVFEHFHAAGEVEEAKTWVLRAARAADASLAFLRAAELYTTAIDLGARGALGGELHRSLGDALLHAGHLTRAADAYLAGALRAAPALRRELLRRAADNYLKSGRDVKGVEVLRVALTEAGLSYPESTRRAVAHFIWHELALRASPLRRRLRAETNVGAGELERIDVAFTAATGLASTDPLRGASFAARGLSLALTSGEPLRMCRALAVAASTAATRGEPGRARAEALVREAERIARAVGEPHALGLSFLAAGAVHFFLGEWRTARAELELAERTLYENCRGVAWELANTRAWLCNVLILSGELAEADRRVRPLMDEATARDDRQFLVHLVYPTSVCCLATDDVDRARDALEVGTTRSVGRWSAGHWGAFISACSYDRYRGDGARAFARVEEEWSWLAGSPLMRSSMVRVFSAYEASLSALAAAEMGVDRRRALRRAARWAKQLAKDNVRFAPPLGLLVEAGIFAIGRNRRAAERALREAIPQLDASDLGYLAACARHRHGELLGGSRGREEIERASAFFTAQGVKRVDRCLGMSSPGFGR